MSPPALFAFDEPMMSIKTGDVTGVYYAAGSAIAKMHNKKRKEYNLRLISETSEGSIANIQDVLNGDSRFWHRPGQCPLFCQAGRPILERPAA